MNTQTELTHSRLLEVCIYNRSTGAFTWRLKRNNRALAGAVATTINKKGYARVKIDRRSHQAHRLAWFYVHGDWPQLDIDHRNRVKTDNWIDNLREATDSFNGQNKVSADVDNSTGVLGVTLHKKAGKFQAQIGLEGKNTYLGLFKTSLEAGQAYLDAKKILHAGAVQ